MKRTPPQNPGRSPAPVESTAKAGRRDWRDCLLLRRYRFPPSGATEHDLAARIDYGGVGYFFPLGTADIEAAASQADRIYQMAAEQGWPGVFPLFPRELIVSFEWCMDPVLWTYTTIHTLVGARVPAANAAPPNPNRQRVLVVELDAGIRRALCWSIDQQPGFASVPVDPVDSFAQAVELHKPRLVILNRNLAGRLGHKSAGNISLIQPDVPALTYSVHVDGDQMFVSTPGGAAGYLVKRVQPDRLLEPIIKVASRSELVTKDFLLRVKHFFQDVLQLPARQASSALAELTPREGEVLRLLSKGFVDKEIAQSMGISPWTVHGHIKRIFEQLHVRTRTEAVIRYLEK